MIGLEIYNNNQPEKIIKEILPNFKPGDTLDDIKDDLIKNNTKFEIRTVEEYYRNKTKKMPRHIDVCCGYLHFDSYGEFVSSKEDYDKYHNIEIKRVSLGSQTVFNGEPEFMEVIDDTINNVSRYIVVIELKKMMLEDNTTPRDYSVIIDREDMVNELTKIDYDEWYD